jgi:hypothetical protein
LQGFSRRPFAELPAQTLLQNPNMVSWEATVSEVTPQAKPVTLSYDIITSSGDVVGSADTVDHAVQLMAGAWSPGKIGLQVVDNATQAIVTAWIGLASGAPDDSGSLAPPEEYS